MIRLVDSQILFYERARSVFASPIKPYLKSLWLITLATILSATFTVHFLFLSTIAHN